MKFKIGDKVRIVDNSIFDSSYRVGSICIIDDIYNDGALRLVMSDCRFQGVTRNHYSYIEKVEDKYMNITDAVNYCLNHKAVIHTPSEDIYNSLMSYLESKGYRWNSGDKPFSNHEHYDEYKKDTGIVFDEGNLLYESISYYAIRDYEIIELTSVSIDGISYSNKDKAISKIESIFSSFPSVGDTYYYINSFGGVNNTIWNNRIGDEIRLSVGNIYKTEELASIALGGVIKAYKG